MIRTIVLLLSALSIPAIANTIEFSAVSKTFQCSTLQAGITPNTTKFDDGTYKGTLIGYKAFNAPAASVLIINDEQRLDFSLSSRPRLSQTQNGCLIRFTADSPPGTDFFEPDISHKIGPRKNLIAAQILITD